MENQIANVIPSEESAEILENNLSEQLQIVRMETLKLKRMLREKLKDKEGEGMFGKI